MIILISVPEFPSSFRTPEVVKLESLKPVREILPSATISILAVFGTPSVLTASFLASILSFLWSSSGVVVIILISIPEFPSNFRTLEVTVKILVIISTLLVLIYNSPDVLISILLELPFSIIPVPPSMVSAPVVVLNKELVPQIILVAFAEEIRQFPLVSIFNWSTSICNIPVVLTSILEELPSITTP